MPRRRGRARMAYSYLTPMWARGTRLADHRTGANRSLARPPSHLREIVNNRMAREIENPRIQRFRTPLLSLSLSAIFFSFSSSFFDLKTDRTEGLFFY